MTQHPLGAAAGPSLQTALTRQVPSTGDGSIRPGELLLASAEVHAGVRDLRRLTASLASRPFDASAADAVVQLLNSPRWHQARSCWRLVQAAQTPLEQCCTAAARGDGVDDEVGDYGTTDNHRGPTSPLVGVQDVDDLLTELQLPYAVNGLPSSPTMTTVSASVEEEGPGC